ncbi:MAG TPA: DUF4012 domain-containing protein [Patescibacteria group bacterium]|nr:DUF4012 domain-containing protein [Patescibacteria group bacterium]
MTEEATITKINVGDIPGKTEKMVETEKAGGLENPEKKRFPLHFKAGVGSQKILLKAGGVLLGLVLLLGVVAGLSFVFLRPLWAQKEVISRDLNELKLALKEQDLVKTKEKTTALKGDLETVQKKLNAFKLAAFIPVVRNYYSDAQHGLKAGLAGLQATDLVIEAISPYTDILGLGGDKSATASGKTTLDRVTFLVTTLDKIRPQLDEVGKELETARKEMDQIDPNRYPEEFRGMKVRHNLVLAISSLDQVAAFVNDAKPLLEVAPDLLGVNSPRYYFVLFQNDAELRPTGGFMTAYGILKVDKGKVTPVLSEDIYSLDAAFRKRLPAPEPIKKFHKNVPYFYLRDMNLSPDFAESMKLFMGHYQENVAGAKKVDGVIAVDTKMLVALIKVLGPIGVPEWGTFTAETDKRCDCPQVVYRLEEIADKPVSTLNTSRKAVIGPLMHSILANAFNSPKSKMADLFKAGLTAVQEKHLLLYLFDEKSQKAAEAFNLAGRIREYDGDYQLLVDTNFAGAKSNLFISQKIEEKIEVAGDGQVTKTLNITYNNPFPASDCGLLSGGLCLNGLYRDWIRLYVPKGSELIEMTGSEIKPNVYEEAGKTVFEGFYGDKYPLRPQSVTKVSFKYKLPFKAGKGKPYKLLIQKQAGVEKYDLVIDFNGKKEEFELRGDKELRW